MTDGIDSLMAQLRSEADADRDAATTPDVGIVMGSDSDMPVMREAAATLTELGFDEARLGATPPAERFSFESLVVSAHRTPDLMYAYAETAAARGLEIVIAGAGGKSADLPNMVASIAFPLPVIGVPIDERSLESVIGMPSGAPLVAVDAGKADNAALSAVQMMARSRPALEDALVAFGTDLRADVGAVSRELAESGVEAFLADRD